MHKETFVTNLHFFDRQRCGLVCLEHAPAADRRQLSIRLCMRVDRRVPREAFEGLSRTDFWTFNTVLDPEKWPEGMNRLKGLPGVLRELEDL
jgi:hypothetical protein